MAQSTKVIAAMDNKVATADKFSVSKHKRAKTELKTVIIKTTSISSLASGTKVLEKDSASRYTSPVNSKRVTGTKMNSWGLLRKIERWTLCSCHTCDRLGEKNSFYKIDVDRNLIQKIIQTILKYEL
jgi:hypothetical protein